MTGRERVIRTLNFQSPDRIPLNFWVLPAARLRYPELDAHLGAVEQDICSVSSFMDLSFDKRIYEPGRFTDVWGSEWQVLQRGMMGEVKKPVLAEDEAVPNYRAPLALFAEGFERNRPLLEEKIRRLRAKEVFINGGSLSLFEQMQFLRGTENLYCDIALESPEFFRIREIVMEYLRAYLDRWLAMDTDGVAFADDWGSQRALLISPEQWRRLFRPCYQELFDRVRKAGKYIFFHSDGYICDLYGDFIEMGISAVNSQLWCMGLEKAEPYAGKITFWGEISRQTTLPNGTPDEIRAAAAMMKERLWKNGGLIGQSEIGRDVPMQNIDALLTCWNSAG